jgi:aspartyl/asparaginyl beta-hydroxylase (cupin superfamily)
MFAKLRAGGNIKAHKDGNAAATFPHKIHIPIQTNEKVAFFVNPKIYHFEKGKAYEVNNLAPHYVENLGEKDRIHLIFEYFNPEHLPANSTFSIKADEDI